MRLMAWCGLGLIAWTWAAGQDPAVARLAALHPGPGATTELRFAHGDNLGWAEPSFDDSSWSRITRSQLPSRAGVYWVRFRVRLEAGATPPDAIALAVVASYDLFWDGHLIGRNGKVAAAPEDEQPGRVDTLVHIPAELNGPGEHVVALRLSSHHTGFPTAHYALFWRLSSWQDYVAYRAWTMAFALVALGGALVVGLVFLLMWLLADRRPALVWFSAACLVAAAVQALQAWRGLLEYPYDWHYPRLLAIALLVGLLGLLLVQFLNAFFGVRRRRWRLLLGAAAMTAVWQLTPMYGVKAMMMCWVALGLSLAVVAQGWRRRRRDAAIILGGILLAAVGLLRGPLEFLEHSFVFTSGAAMLGCVTALTLQWRDERRLAREMKLTAARLETELLKKNLQPHFVLNTLATIVEVIEQEPRTAVTLIEALATEFRILARISGERLVPLEQELELCRAHLRVMSLRKAAPCGLAVVGATSGEVVPPALFHTLVENGLTHLLPRDGRLDFELEIRRRPEAVRYALRARGQRQLPAAPSGTADGTGMRYIKARLEESFTGCWTLSCGPCDEGWITVVEIRAGRGAVAPRRDGPAAPLPFELTREPA